MSLLWLFRYTHSKLIEKTLLCIIVYICIFFCFLNVEWLGKKKIMYVFFYFFLFFFFNWNQIFKQRVSWQSVLGSNHPSNPAAASCSAVGWGLRCQYNHCRWNRRVGWTCCPPVGWLVKESLCVATQRQFQSSVTNAAWSSAVSHCACVDKLGPRDWKSLSSFQIPNTTYQYLLFITLVRRALLP